MLAGIQGLFAGVGNKYILKAILTGGSFARKELRCEEEKELGGGGLKGKLYLKKRKTGA